MSVLTMTSEMELVERAIELGSSKDKRDRLAGRLMRDALVPFYRFIQVEMEKTASQDDMAELVNIIALGLAGTLATTAINAAKDDGVATVMALMIDQINDRAKQILEQHRKAKGGKP
jgi:hypothetical protein